MAFKKYGRGRVLRDSGQKQAAAEREWTEADREELRRENIEADASHDTDDTPDE